ncbi:MAG: hypothetical protein DRI57_28990 [Deltaproteobacteria bacterium]|nr:MAG: hypothetical protein DRI57_28990 [Deltaproteobacteria bacterium]
MSLAEKFRNEIFQVSEASLTTQHKMIKDDFQHKLPISFLGTYVTEKSGEHKNETDLKKSGSVHIINGMRIFAIKNRISEPSTFGRLR